MVLSHLLNGFFISTNFILNKFDTDVARVDVWKLTFFSTKNEIRAMLSHLFPLSSNHHSRKKHRKNNFQPFAWNKPRWDSRSSLNNFLSADKLKFIFCDKFFFLIFCHDKMITSLLQDEWFPSFLPLSLSLQFHNSTSSSWRWINLGKKCNYWVTWQFLFSLCLNFDFNMIFFSSLWNIDYMKVAYFLKFITNSCSSWVSKVNFHTFHVLLCVCFVFNF